VRHVGHQEGEGDHDAAVDDHAAEVGVLEAFGNWKKKIYPASTQLRNIKETVYFYNAGAVTRCRRIGSCDRELQRQLKLARQKA
jgi:hypothetical protein